MKHIFLINSYTITKEINNLIDKIKLACNKLNIDYKIELNSSNYQTEEILKKYTKTNYIILAVGGDGTLNRVLNSIQNTQNILGFIPYGTGNDFYKSSLIQFNKLYNKCDLIKINNKYFINTACFGIDADVANNKFKSKIFNKKQKYIIGLIKTFFKYKAKEMQVKINDKHIKDKFTTIVVCNGMYYGNGFNISPSSKLNDNLINVYIARNMYKINMLDLILKMKKGKHENHKRIEKYETNKLTIKSNKNIKCNIDGEELEAKKFDLEVIKQIDVYYNKDLIKYILN